MKEVRSPNFKSKLKWPLIIYKYSSDNHLKQMKDSIITALKTTRNFIHINKLYYD